ncbi:Calcium/proton exchanger [Hortaea werneckii]|nr:Calcium/proton exchanger [Hortaea werneckii]
MHSIKKAARREAWFNNNNDDENRLPFNLVGRWHPQQQQRALDEEEGGAGGAGGELEHRRTENDAEPTSIEMKRREADRPTSGLRKAPTFPDGRSDINIPDKQIERGLTSSGGSEKPLTSGILGETETNGETCQPPGQEEASGPRKRNIKAILTPWKKQDDPHPDQFERTETSETKKKRPKLTFISQFKAVFGSWINLLLVFVPVGIALEYTGVNRVVVFVINFLAIIPLAAVLSYSTEELAMYIGETLGGLLNATFGNAVELIVSIIALAQGKIPIVQTSLIGSMLSNLLLVLGMCFFLGGARRTEQFFNLTVAQTASSLLALAIGSLIIPTAFVQFGDRDQAVVPASRGTAVMLLFVYLCYLIFQLKTHVDMYNEPSQKSPKKPSGKKEAGDMMRGLATIGAGTGAAAAGGEINRENLIREEPEEEETPQLTIIGAVVTLAISTVFIALCAEYMVSAIGEVAESVSPEFIGLILLPIVGNAAEHATAVTVAIKDKMDLAIGVAVGSSLQISLLVLPVMVLLSWFGVGQPADLTLSFDGFQVAVLFISIVVVNYVIMDGKSHWLEGIMLMVAYLIIAVVAWFYPAEQGVAG